MAIGTETGNAHIAAAVGTQSVIITGGGHFGRFLPYHKSTSLVVLPLDCFNCNWNCKYEQPYCIKDILPSVLYNAIIQIWEKPSDKPRIFVQGQSFYDQTKNKPLWNWFYDLLDFEKVEIVNLGEAPEIKSDKLNASIQYLENLLLENKIEEIAKVLPRLIEKHLQSKDFLIYCAELLININLLDEAEVMLLEMEKIYPNNEQIMNDLGVVYILSKQNQQALDKFQQVLNLNPESELAKENLNYLKLTK